VRRPGRLYPGITEATDETDQEFGTECLHASTRHAAAEHPAKTIRRISHEVDLFSHGIQAGDQTLLVVKRLS